MNGHPLDELSALLDGELGGEEEAAVRRHLAGCGPCRQQLAAIGETRSALRSLSRLDPPVGWTDRFVRRLRRILALVAGVAAAVAAGAAGAMWAAAPVRDVTPAADLLSQPAPARAAAGVTAAGVVSAGYVAPDRLGAMWRVELYRAGATLRVVYSDGVRRVFLVEEVGRLDSGWAGARPGPSPGAPGPSGYRWAGGAALTWQAGPAVMTMVGDPASVVEAAAALPVPSRHETVGARARRLCRELLEDLSGSG